MEQISFGTYGFQDNFWSGQSQTSPSRLKSRLIEIDAVTGQVTEGFILLPRNAEIEYFDVTFTQNSIYNT